MVRVRVRDGISPAGSTRHPSHSQCCSRRTYGESDANELARLSTAPQAARARVDGGEWSPSAVARLRDFYEPFNVELSHLMDGDPRFLW